MSPTTSTPVFRNSVAIALTFQAQFWHPSIADARAATELPRPRQDWSGELIKVVRLLLIRAKEVTDSGPVRLEELHGKMATPAEAQSTESGAHPLVDELRWSAHIASKLRKARDPMSGGQDHRARPCGRPTSSSGSSDSTPRVSSCSTPTGVHAKHSAADLLCRYLDCQKHDNALHFECCGSIWTMPIYIPHSCPPARIV